MRTWRVGTFSMGAALILLGVTLIAGHYFKENVINVWVPILLIIVGSEILCYLFFHKKETSFVKYDSVSIFFVSILGTCGIVFTFAAGAGLVGEWENALYAKEITKKLPSYEESISPSIKKVVLVNGEANNVYVQRSTESDLHVFGTHTSMMYKEKNKDTTLPLKKVADTKVIGNTLYLTIHSIPHERGIFRAGGYSNINVVVPEAIQVTTASGETL
ncbi:hypothetical protein KUV80_14005 [Fictibacillus nanhaiensis]|uniref:hypothetical protein n=1 Tax=Fictibacillus nanhaiensis TaxID=742169 RepID=UPI001C977055|nr:hypothetical protein [Fictibacillus nanhaiensis]MBY6037781.1 hypothetical protein [Fictibacillus nanhaiensis]